MIISKYIQLGANASLDQTIFSLAKVSKHCSAQVVEALMEWRGKKLGEIDSSDDVRQKS